MNFLLRPTQSAAAAAAVDPPQPAPVKSVATTLEGLIAGEDKSAWSPVSDHRDSISSDNGSVTSSSNGNSNNNGPNFGPIVDKHIDVKEDDGCVTIPFKKLPDDWGGAPDMHWFRSLDRSFVFPGEQVHIIACLSESKQETEILTPFKVAAMMNKNVIGQSPNGQNEHVIDNGSQSESQQVDPSVPVDGKSKNNRREDLSASESALRMADHRRQTQTLLQRFKDSHFFVRIAESGEPLWSKRTAKDASETVDDSGSMKDEKSIESGTSINAVIDSGRFDARVSGGLARNSVKCASLANGDIVVVLQVNVGADPLNEPVLEILQFEKHQNSDEAQGIGITPYSECNPYGELLKWLLPLENSSNPVNRPRSPPLASPSHKTSLSASSGSQLFSFGHFRSYSMSSLPQNVPPAASPPPISVASSKPNFDLEDWEHFASHKSLKNSKTGGQDLLSFRGVPLEPERFSACCGLEGIYIPGRRWRKRLEVIQPVDIHTFAADCNTDDLLCVQIKNVAPAHLPDIVVYIDAITIILEEASKDGPPLSVPLASVEAGTDYSLPNLMLRRGEEHSFILKPSTSALKKSTFGEKVTKLSRPKSGSRTGSMRLPPKAVEGKRTVASSSSDKYAVLVSCHCNYSESRLFFKKPTDWRPRTSRDLMISVASEISKQTMDPTSRMSHLPVQVLTLEASNLTSEDLTLTILAPASFTSPSVVSLTSAPSSPTSAFGLATTEKQSTVVENRKPSGATHSLSFDDQTVPAADAIPATAMRCTHLWLHSRAPLGCVPSQSTATIKLELLPLTDGIITLDTLQIDVKEKGQTYLPERALKINATSSIATEII